MLFAILCEDRPDGLDTRLATRTEHLAWLTGLGSRLKFAGPFIGATDKPVGSMLVFDAADEADARRLAEADPYARAGLFAKVEIRRWNWVVNNPEAGR